MHTMLYWMNTILFFVGFTLHGGENLGFEFVGKFGIVTDDLLHRVATLTEFAVAVREPAAALFDDSVLHAEVNYFAGVRDAFAEHNFEFSLAEWRCHLVLHHFHAGGVANHVFAVFQLTDAANVEAHRAVELEGVAAGGGFGVAEQHANLVAKLVDEYAAGVGL